MGCLESTHDNGDSWLTFIAEDETEFPQKKTPDINLPQVLFLLGTALPIRPLTATEAIRIVNYHLKRNRVAYASHRKRGLSDYFGDRRRRKLRDEGLLSL